MTEKISLDLATPEFAVMVVRPRFVWGRDDSTALPKLVSAVRSGKFAWIDGGNYLTSTTHIDNLCLGVELTLEKGRSREIYFITDGNPVTFRKIVDGLLRSQGMVIPDKSVPRAVVKGLALIGSALERMSGGRLSGAVNMQTYATSAVEVTVDISKAARELGYLPVVSIQHGLSHLSSQALRAPTLEAQNK